MTYQELLNERYRIAEEIRKINDDTSLSREELETKMYQLDSQMEEVEDMIFILERNNQEV